jgi:hypothetical protein
MRNVTPGFTRLGRSRVDGRRHGGILGFGVWGKEQWGSFYRPGVKGAAKLYL